MSTKNQTNSISVLKSPFNNNNINSKTPSARQKVSINLMSTLQALKVQNVNVNDNSIIELIKKNILKLSLGNINNYLPTSLKINNEELIIIKEYINSINQNGNNNSKDKKNVIIGGGQVEIAKLIHVLLPLMIVFTSLVLYANNIVDPFICKSIRYRLFGFFFNRPQIEYCKLFNLLGRRYDNFLYKLEAVSSSANAHDAITKLSIVFTDLGLLMASSYAFLESYKFTVNKVASTINESIQFSQHPIKYIANGMATTFSKKAHPTSAIPNPDLDILEGARDEDDILMNLPDGNEGDPDEDEDGTLEDDLEQDQQGGRKKRKPKTEKKVYKAKKHS